MKEKKDVGKMHWKNRDRSTKYQKHFFEKTLWAFFLTFIDNMLCIYEKDGESDIHISLRKKNLFFGIIISKQLQKSSPINQKQPLSP